MGMSAYGGLPFQGGERSYGPEAYFFVILPVIVNTASETFEALLTQVQRLIQDPSAKTMTGEAFMDVPVDKVILKSVTLWPSEDKKVQINVTTADAYPAFEWLAEITIDDQTSGYSHYLLRTDNTLVETYGKNVQDVSPEAAQKLLAELSAT
jgi:hypothetical protein